MGELTTHSVTVRDVGANLTAENEYEEREVRLHPGDGQVGRRKQKDLAHRSLCIRKRKRKTLKAHEEEIFMTRKKKHPKKEERKRTRREPTPIRATHKLSSSGPANAPTGKGAVSEEKGE